MSKFSKRFALCLVILCLAVMAANAQQSIPPKTAWPGYALAVFVGFGSGQYYLGTNGTPFLIGDIAGVAVMTGGFTYMMISDIDPYTAITIGYLIVIAGGLLYSVTRVWEIADIFITAERMRQAGKVVNIVPEIGIQPAGVCLRMSLRY